MRYAAAILASGLTLLPASSWADWSAEPAQLCSQYKINPCDLLDIKEYARTHEIPSIVSKDGPIAPPDKQPPISSEGKTCKEVIKQRGAHLWLCF